jgi:hypothetical protein
MTGMARATQDSSEQIQQCEVCACWTRDGSVVGEQPRFICRSCKREAKNNWFIRSILKSWDRKRSVISSEHFPAAPLPTGKV